jgi:tRNA-specific 2-thiouridylase
MQTVFVGLSGGVDSAVSVYLLKKQGYRVIGAFIKAWEPDFLPCTGAEDRLSAMRVAASLSIPFVMYDLGEEYKRDVVDYFVKEYKAGRTPNPDVMCNRFIKFGAFWERAKMDGADMLATGHYAVNERSASGFHLLASKDKEKDQTYFLWTLTQDDLSRALFPVGGMEKPEVRKIAREAWLPNASRKDSQGLCFLGHVDMAAFLKRYIPAEHGVVRDESDAVLGEHDGAVFYTFGQRISVGGMSERRYVIAKDISKNELVVSAHLLGEYARRECSLSGISWISGKAPEGKALARYRYRQRLIPATLAGNKVVFDDPQLIAAGQSVVFYDVAGSECLGGGVAS